VKRKIVIGLAIYSAVFLLAGIYIVLNIRSTTANLDKLIELHQVEILREHYLLQIKRVQSDLTLIDTHFSRPPDTVVTNIINMEKLIDSCFQCHHSPQGTERLKGLQEQTAKYKDALNRVLRTHTHHASPDAEEEAAFRIGEELIAQVRDMVDATTMGLEKHTRKAMSEIARTKYLLYGLVGFGPLVSALLGFVFISGLTRPLNVLLESTRKLKGGDLDHRVVELRDEFGELAVSFNEMAGSLKDQMIKMGRTEQMVVCGELAAGLAHEIKNPIAGIKAAMQVLSEEADLSEEDRGVVKMVAQETVRLESLMKDFLNFAKPAKPRFEEVNVNYLVNTILAFYLKSQSISTDSVNGIRITKDLQPLPETMADPVQLQQILLNIFLNAVDSMPNGGTLNVRTSYDQGPGEICIEISDTGRGISSEHVDKIFQPFFTTKPKGTGLGLAISKQLIEQHGGSIAVAGNPAGGTVFRVRIPSKTPAAVTTA
jgi:signal transduction histidine kinase